MYGVTTRSKGGAPSTGLLRRSAYSTPRGGGKDGGQRLAHYQHKNPGIMAEPEMQQAAVVNSVYFYKDEAKIRRKRINRLSAKSVGGRNSELLAPLSSNAQDFVVKQFDPVYTIDGDKMYTDLPVSTNASIDPNPASTQAGFATVNGLFVNAPLRFIGISTVDQDPTKVHTLDVGTVNTFGTQTTWNSGPARLKINSSVFFDPRPFASIGPDGQMINHAVLMGHPETKFRPALYSITNTDAYSMFSTAVEEMRQQMRDTAIGLNASNEDVAVKKMDDLVEEIMIDRPPSLPLPVYLWTHFLHLALIHSSPTDIDAAGKLKLIAKNVYNRVVKDMEKDRDGFNAAIGQTSATQAPLHPAFKIASELDESASQDAWEKQRTEMLEAITDLEVQLTFNFRAWLRQHYMGTCLTDAPSGREFLLLINAGPFCG